MLDRLKSLPLTIILTLLIWMYAESQVNLEQDNIRLEVPDVPVSISASPQMLERYNVTIKPQVVTVTVSVVPSHDSPMPRVGKDIDIHAYLEIKDSDVPGEMPVTRALRIVAPPGLTVSQPPEVTFKLAEKASHF